MDFQDYMEDSFKKGEEAGYQKGEEAGYRKGEKAESMKLIMNLVKNTGMDIRQVMEVLGIPADRYEEIINARSEEEAVSHS